MSGGGRVDPSKIAARRKGIKLCLLVTESNSCRSAYRFLKAFLVPALDEVHLVTAVTSETGRANAITRQRELVEAEILHTAHFHVAVKEEDYTLFESLGRYIATAVKPDIIFMGSTNLCTNLQSAVPIPRINPAGSRGSPASSSASSGARRQGSLTRNAAAAGAAASSVSGSGALNSAPTPSVLGSSCLALRVLPELRCAPVLLAKYNSRGSWLVASAAATAAANGTASGVTGGGVIGKASPSTSRVSPTAANGNEPSSPSGQQPTSLPRSRSSRPPTALQHSPSMGPSNTAGAGATNGTPPSTPAMRVMVDLQPNSRHVLDWLFEHFTAGRDHLVLTVSQAYDDQHHVKPAAQRLLTAFGVQAAVNLFEADTATLEGPPNKSLPAAVLESEPDLLVLQAPRCRGIPPSIAELLYTAKTSFLIWPPDYQAQ